MFKLKRVDNNPILAPILPWEKEGVFNPGVVLTTEGVVMLYRAVGERQSYISHFGLAKSKDGVTFERFGDKPVFGPKEDFDKCATEDPRITEIDGNFYVPYVAVPDPILINGESVKRDRPLVTSVALLKTSDFINYENLGIISPVDSDNKDIVLFPRKINGRYAMLHRSNHWSTEWCKTPFQKTGNENMVCATPNLPRFPAIWIAFSDDLKTWDDHEVIMSTPRSFDAKIGAGLPPIETRDGWLLIYHNVQNIGRGQLVYSVRASLLSLKDPRKTIASLPYDILSPEAPYEIENGRGIVFPTGGFVHQGTLYVYYGASDKYICLATGRIDELLSELRKTM